MWIRNVIGLPLSCILSLCQVKSWNKLVSILIVFLKRMALDMMVAIDYFSKWSEAKPLQNKSAISVARSLFELICRFVASPSRLMTRHENLWTPGECKLYKGITNFIHRYSGVQIPGSTYYMLHGFIDSWLSVNFKAASTSYSGAVVCFFLAHSVGLMSGYNVRDVVYSVVYRWDISE